MKKDDMIFQILDWNYYQEENEDGKDYVIRLFGKTKQDKTIYVKAFGFTPYFYIQIDDKWKKDTVDKLVQILKDSVTIKGDNGWAKCENSFKGYIIEEKYKFRGFTNFKKFKFIKLIFRDLDSMRGWAGYLNKKKFYPGISSKAMKFPLFESNIEPFLRCMHIRNLDAVGWVKIESNKIIALPNETCCDINISTKWNNLTRVEERTIMPFVIASFDLECTSEDGSFPQAERDGDQIIQIGTTFSRFGENECFYQHILTLGSCDPIEGAIVVSCKTEKELLIEWSKMIRKTNPDIITGYNIFGFDYKYLKNRAKKLGIEYQFSKLSRVNDECTQFKEKDLSSAALGKNIMTYYDMTGRINIDLMKVVQRDYKLASYKLDYVASYFIKEDIISVSCDPGKNTTKILTKSRDGVKINQYITVNYNDGITENKHMSGKKFKIIDFIKEKVLEKDKNKGEIYVERDAIIVEGCIDTDIFGKGYKIFWCQAKDDVSAKDIFRLQKGTSKDRAIIAKYCLMDCALCNKLMAKLCVITNNVGMANVCHVPLSYIFYRGQGIKIFSLVAKKCREKEHLIPLLEKKKAMTDEEKKQYEKENTEEVQFEKFIKELNNKGLEDHNDETDDDENDSYEGATVFPPQKGVHFDPVPVLDYASLYPRSMILKNLSHEYLVMDDEKYGNLPGYRYHLTTYMVSKIVEDVDKKYPQASIIIFKDRLQKTIKKYKELKYVIEQVKKNNGDNVTSIYDIDKEGKKRFLVTEITINEKEFRLVNFETSKFAEKLDGTKGIIPEILQGLLDAREHTKKLMEGESDKFKKSVLDGKQLAEKVTANSLYGQTGSPVSAIFMKEIAASTTATGKEHLEFSRDFLEGLYNNMINLALTDKKEYINLCKKEFSKISDNKFVQPKNGFVNREQFYDAFYNKVSKMLADHRTKINVIYGDSVTGETPILLKNPTTNKIVIKRIDELGTEWKNYNNYKSSDSNRYFRELLTILFKNKNVEKKRENFVPVSQWMYIKNNKYRYINDAYSNNTYLQVNLNNNKNMICDVEDIDIINCELKNISKMILNKIIKLFPKQIQAKLQKYEVNYINENSLDNRKCNLSIDVDNQTIDKIIEDIENDQKDRYSKEQSTTNYLAYTDKGWAKINKIIRHKTTKKIYRILTTNSIVEVTCDHSLIDENGNYIMPKDCVIGKGLMQSYPHTNKLKYNDKYDKSIFTNKNYKECMKYYHYNKSHGFNITIDENNGIITLKRTKDNINNINKIVKIFDLGDISTDRYVYDLETEHGRFHAGVGELIVTNTDSTFFKPQITNNKTGEIRKDFWSRECCIQLGIWASITICILLNGPMQMAYEKVLHPFIILTKKRYVGNLYESDPNKFYTKSMGIVLKRRDNAPIVKVVVGGIVDQILNKQSSKGAVDFTKKVLKDILSSKYSIDKYIITKTLRGPGLNFNERMLESKKEKGERYYADRNTIVHAVLADRIADRDYGNRPQSNDRIEYVYRVVKGDVELQGDRVETPEFIKENNLSIDHLFYITNQIMKPSIQFLELLIDEPEKIFESYIVREENRRKGQKTIKAFCGDIDNDNNEKNDVIDLNKEIDKHVIIEKKPKVRVVKSKKKNTKVKTSDFSNFEETDGGFKITD
ncbi:DNA polymerase family B elongation subunit [Catovirus CTV1]|uniref:DNA-directed DNA polymerase n=1 Tax=Catovirus CTV1 TaxID=1977631 RepID=A0A1V0SC95_9VIRU|nr:DNA polymerase family B elongation subunit [Catovirus CTV1]